jgi:hypothetical protein
MPTEPFLSNAHNFAQNTSEPPFSSNSFLEHSNIDNNVYENESILFEKEKLSAQEISFSENSSNNTKRRSEYFSISSNAIQCAGNISGVSAKSHDSEEYNEFTNFNQMPNVFLLKTYSIFYFEVNYLMLWVKEVLKSTYPELTFVLLIEIDDDKNTQEKIFFSRSKENNKYVPMLKKEDIGRNHYRTLKIIEKEENLFDRMGSTHKISITLCTFSKGKLIPISQEDMYIQMKAEPESKMQKYKMYKNMNLKYNNKKVGNILFNFIYKKETLNYSELHENYTNFFILSNFSKIENISTYQEDSSYPFLYYGIKNYSIKPNGSLMNLSKGSGFFSIHDIDDIEISGELRGEQIHLERLLELLGLVKKKYDLYEVLRKLNSYITKKELNEEKLMTFKERLLKRLEEISISKDLFDPILIPYIFFTVKNLFYKSASKTKNTRPNKDYSNSSNSFNNSQISKDNKNKKNSIQEDEDIISSALHLSDSVVITEPNTVNKSEYCKEKSLLLLFNSFILSFEFIQETNSDNEFDAHPDIVLSALNYIHKNIEQTFELEGFNLLACGEIDSRIQLTNMKTSDDFFFSYICNNNLDRLLCELLFTYYDNPYCVLPITGIFSKMIKIKKDNLSFFKVLSHEIYRKDMRNIIRHHECNSAIMTNLFNIISHNNFLESMTLSELFIIVNLSKLKEIMLNFKMNGYDQIHDATFNLIKAILIKKSDSIQNSDSSSNSLNDEDFVELIAIFSVSFQLIKNKIVNNDLQKLSKSAFSFLTIIYTIANIINNISNSNNEITFKICLDKKIPDHLIDIFFFFFEKGFFMNIDKIYERIDINSLNTKLMIFRTLFHCMILLKNLKNYSPACLVRISFN